MNNEVKLWMYAREHERRQIQIRDQREKEENAKRETQNRLWRNSYIVMIDNRIVKNYPTLEDAEEFCKWIADRITPKSEFSIEICVLPMEECFDTRWSMLSRNNFMPRGNKYHITDYQQWYSQNDSLNHLF